MKEILGIQPGKKVEIASEVDVTGLPSAVAEATIWGNYWFGFWGSIPNMAKTGGELTAWPVRPVNGADVYVFVDELHSVFICSFEKKYACDTLWNFGDSLGSAGPQFEEYESDKQRYSADRQKLSISLRPDLLRTVEFSPFDDAKIRKIETLFDQHVLDKEFFQRVRQGRTRKLSNQPIRIRVGDFNLDSFLIYFYINGDPYLSTIWLDPTGNRFTYLEEWSTDYGILRYYYPHAVKRIQENGAWFVVKNGKLVKDR